MFSTYDSWKLACPDDLRPEPNCLRCEDQGCPDCCETQPVALEDLDEMDAEEAAGTIRETTTRTPTRTPNADDPQATEPQR